MIDDDALVDRLKRIASSMTFRSAWTWPTTIVIALDAYEDVLNVTVQIMAPDIVTGLPTTVNHRQYLGVYSANRMSDDDVIAYLRRCMLMAVQHEFDECLLVDGKQLTNPHEAKR